VFLIEAGRIVRDGDPGDVVRQYVAKVGGGPLSWRRGDQSVDGAGIVAVTVVDGNGAPVSVLTTATTLRVRIIYRLTRPCLGVVSSVGLLDAHGTPILVTTPADVGVETASMPGTYEATVTFPGEILLGRTYGIRVALSQPHVAVYDAVDAITFSVEEVASLGTHLPHEGEVVVPCEWSAPQEHN
jgi:hypothetical protein